ncbi:MAG: histidine kinase [Ferruginibacter sp.]|nr:histidine kinase [Ferruginibacter sp.]
MTHQTFYHKLILVVVLLCAGNIGNTLYAQVSETNKKFKKASRKVESGIEINNTDTLAQGYFDLGESYYQKNDLLNSEYFYQKAKLLFDKIADATGIAKSSRALAKVQEGLNKNAEAIVNYDAARQGEVTLGNINSTMLNSNDISRLSKPYSLQQQQKDLQKNIDISIKNKDTTEVIASYGKMGKLQWQNNGDSVGALVSYKNAYQYSINIPEEAIRYNQLITNSYLKDKNFSKAIETKKEILGQEFVLNSTQTTASEIFSLADIYIQKNDDSAAIELLNESYGISVKNGHTLEARKCVEKLDSIFQSKGKKQLSLELYKDFLLQLPAIIEKDSSLTDNRIISQTEEKLKILETEKALKDDLIRKKNTLNYWLIGSVLVLSVFLAMILHILKKLKVKNKKIALQSLRREMNPHFIFNSLNSINQFIANNNEMEANQYLAKFSALMRSVMENSKHDLILFSKETSLLKNYLALEQSRFPDKFNFKIHIDDALYADEQLYIPGMLIQPHLENAIWHGLRYKDEGGFLDVRFSRKNNIIEVTIEDNGIGIAESKNAKTINQQKHSGRGISNTLERIKILNELYRQNITCIVQDKAAPDYGVKVRFTFPLLKHNNHED